MGATDAAPRNAALQTAATTQTMRLPREHGVPMLLQAGNPRMRQERLREQGKLEFFPVPANLSAWRA